MSDKKKTPLKCFLGSINQRIDSSISFNISILSIVYYYSKVRKK